MRACGDPITWTIGVTARAMALCMLVRDDETVIERSLRSVHDLIDYWVICDAGSQDRTSEIVTDVLADIPGELHRRAWLDFGHNRSELMQLAHDKADYLLLLDADMTLVRSGPMPQLLDDSYILREAGDNPANGVSRIVRGSRPWWYEGSTHEVLMTNGRYSEAELDALVIERHTDDALRTRTLVRQLDILEREVATGPPTPRTVFHLAQTLRDLGRPWAAIEWYRQRKELGDSDEETFYANFQEGVLRSRNDFLSAVPVLLEAWQRRPTRAEPLYELAHGYCERDDALLAHHFANLGLQIPLPSDALFVDRRIYEWGLRYLRGWAAGRLGRFDEAEEDLRAVLETEGVHADFAELAQGWLDDLKEFDEQAEDRLPTRRTSDGREVVPLASMVEDLRMGKVLLDVSPPWPTFNPSISPDGDGFSMIVRSQNVEFEHGELSFDEDTHHNVNYLVKLDAALGVTTVERINADPDGMRVEGFVDLRLIEVDGRWLATGWRWQLGPSDRSVELALLDLDEARVTGVHLLKGPDRTRQDKNWMPFVRDGELHYVYTCGPMVVFRYEHQTGGLTLAAESESPRFASSFRGGSQGLALDDGGYLFVVHETYYQGKTRSYLHRFIRINQELRLSAVSQPFTFTDDVREFCAGVAVSGLELVLSFGVRHTEAWLAVLPLAGALDLLEPIQVT
jgi:tetratricopeptide (TPR) repeat protein